MKDLFENEYAPEKKRSKDVIFNDYDGFVDKFKAKKTTDDCYTPKEVYEAVKSWVNENIMPLDGVKIVRPFYPGGDYERFDYPAGCLVLDNPPFSISAKIYKFYVRHGIRFFLFAPAMTLFSSVKRVLENVTMIVCGTHIEYENKAKVPTSFVTNLDCAGVGVWVSGTLVKAIKNAQKDQKQARSVYEYPKNITSAALLQKISIAGEELKIGRGSYSFISRLDDCKRNGREIFGGGLILSEKAAAEKAAAEKAAAEKAAKAKKEIYTFQLSNRERRIISELE